MRIPIVVAVVFVLVAPGVPASADDSAQARARAEFRCGARNASSAPSYLFVEVHDPVSDERWQAAFESTRLIEWVRRDRGLELRDAIDFLSAKSGATEWPPVLEPISSTQGGGLRPAYSSDALREARAQVARFTDEEIRTRMIDSDPPLGPAPSPSGDAGSYDALAHALIERGHFPSRDDMAPHFYVSPSPCAKACEVRAFLDRLCADAEARGDPDLREKCSGEEWMEARGGRDLDCGGARPVD